MKYHIRVCGRFFSLGKALFFAIALLFLPGTTPANEPSPLDNLSNWITGWAPPNDRGMSMFGPEAARTGEDGLRVIDEDTARESNVTSHPLEAIPGKKYEVTFWVRRVSGTGDIGVLLFFRNELDRTISSPKSTRLPVNSTEWQEFKHARVAPESARTLFVSFRSSKEGTGVIDVADIKLRMLEE